MSVDEQLCRFSKQIEEATLDQLPAIIDQVRDEKYADIQLDIIRSCLRRVLRDGSSGGHFEPRDAQVQAMHRLVFIGGDTLLIARTGFGKSIIFHTFSILTGKITLQIIPLSKLGEEQVESIKRLNGTRPCLLSYESKQAEQNLLSQIRNGHFTHILLGPEQAASRSFRRVLKDHEFRFQVGLVAIDECHLVGQWAEFRPQFTMLGELRNLLPDSTVWFACSATLSDKAERSVLDRTGFRPIGNGRHRAAVIRTSIDRPDLSISVQPIARGQINSYNALHFLLDDCLDADGRFLPERIPKTIVFIDGRRKIANAVHQLRSWLSEKTSCDEIGYNTTATATPRSHQAIQIIQEFTARVAVHDRKVRYEEFVKPESTIRIMVATAVLGTGVNIADVQRVVIWNFPIDRTLAEVWQRLGRGGRAPGMISQGYIFLPYWVFDNQGCSPLIPEQDSQGHMSRAGRGRKSYHRSTQSKLTRSRLQQSFTPGDLSDADSIDSAMSTQPTQVADTPTWTLSDIRKRTALKDSGIEWLEMVNAVCHRRAFLTYLGENKLTPNADITTVLAAKCCTACNPSLHGALSIAPPAAKDLSRPKAGSMACFALEMIEEWIQFQANKIYAHADRRFDMPSSAFMEVDIQWQLAYLFRDQIDLLQSLSSFRALVTAAPLLQDWYYKDQYCQQLTAWIQTIVPVVSQRYLEHRRGVRCNKGASQGLDAIVSGSDIPLNQHVSADLTDTEQQRPSTPLSQLIGQMIMSPIHMPPDWSPLSIGSEAVSPSILAAMQTLERTRHQASEVAALLASKSPRSPSRPRPVQPYEALSEVSTSKLNGVRQSRRIRTPSRKMRDN
ncbi:uncharacterized protein PV09_09841 [Verruconis gallopava]|uniref:DNA 3'-5' helicase n=1 Tax=Verruconis gallopava TaxID=253628 RepID=A0A0D2AH96_9PEZI|nr:uncharacterized protein PV09_09841 [Verruconis gallopava]KIV98313.1 hypothetical protein PV09_09841 [Verruconis gallopava]